MSRSIRSQHVAIGTKSPNKCHQNTELIFATVLREREKEKCRLTAIIAILAILAVYLVEVLQDAIINQQTYQT